MMDDVEGTAHGCASAGAGARCRYRYRYRYRFRCRYGAGGFVKPSWKTRKWLLGATAEVHVCVGVCVGVHMCG